ncbi:hypothetical protein [Xanthomonas theicola]|uniref:Relaxation protein n=1 Tax=Xanthomonas theicola TaxID=56464 RepID=A0A2S6ZJK1_9XANT|nr:hypothetical protein [Xanthomonas theicola]PPT92428.1 hypothetical protein XthCFBP4691_04265 [Xanthomonas theicola]QNH25148.1 hypothetical protein G4Q83_10915 [Xanthomonas theicola]
MHDLHPDAVRELQDAIAYLKKTTGQILTYQQYQRKQFESQWQRLDQHIAALDQSARSMAGSAGRIVSDASQGIREQAKASISQGAGEAFGHLRGAMDAATHALRASVAAVADERTQLARDRKTFVWSGLACLGIGAVLAAFGVGAYSWASLKEVGQAERRLAHLRALDGVEAAPCGDGYCASVDLKAKVSQGGKTYYRIKPRHAD